MRSVRLSSRYDFAPIGIPRKQHNRRFCHRYVVAQQSDYREARDFWQTWGIPAVSKALDQIDNKKVRIATLELRP